MQDQFFFIHKPWYQKNFTFPSATWKDSFDNFISGKNCPKAASLPYHCAVNRYLENMEHYEPVSTKHNLNQYNHDLNEEENKEIADFLAMTGIHQDNEDNMPDPESVKFDYGINYDWTTIDYQLPKSSISPAEWLDYQINILANISSDSSKNGLDLPMKIDCTGKQNYYKITDLKKYQRKVMAYILHSLKEWEKYDPHTDPPFKPVRLIV